MMLGGQAGSRLLTHLYMPTSHDALVRLIRKWQSGDAQTPHAMGVDDWAIRKAKTYGTILTVRRSYLCFKFILLEKVQF
jgi:hypothetical protein